MSLQDGDTGLILAARKGHTETVKVLVDYRAAVDLRNKVTCTFVIAVGIWGVDIPIILLSCLIAVSEGANL